MAHVRVDRRKNFGAVVRRGIQGKDGRGNHVLANLAVGDEELRDLVDEFGLAKEYVGLDRVLVGESDYAVSTSADRGDSL